MTSPLKEDKMGVYIELLEMDVWIHKTKIATELAIKENSKKRTKNTNIWIFSMKKRHIDFSNQDPGTTKVK
jgi:DNA-directed RNA polymerase subunit E'/Rpb7